MAGPYLYLGVHLTELRTMLTVNKSNLYGCVWGHCALVVSGSCTKLLALDDHNVTHALHVHVTHHLDAGRVIPLRMFDVHVYCLYCCLPAYVVCGCYDWGGGGSVALCLLTCILFENTYASKKFQDLSQWRVHLVIVHVYDCSELPAATLTQHPTLYTCCRLSTR